MGAKTTSLENTLSEPTVTTNKESVQSLIERLIAAHTVTKVNDDMAVTAVERDFLATDYKQKPLPKFFVKLPSYMTNDIECALADLLVVTKTDFGARV